MAATNSRRARRASSSPRSLGPKIASRHRITARQSLRAPSRRIECRIRLGLSDPSTAVQIEGLPDANPIGGISARFSPIRFLLTGAAPSPVRSWQRVCAAPPSKKRSSLDEWLPERHLARFVVEVVEGLDLRAMTSRYRGSGEASYHPQLLLGLMIYGYATGVFSSRKLERATYDSVAFRFIAANEHPDHDTIAVFRRRFLKQIEPLFVQVLGVARELYAVLSRYAWVPTPARRRWSFS